METVLTLMVVALYAAGVYLMLRRSMVKLLFGLALLSNATNLLIFTCARIIGGRPPLVEPGQTVLAAPYADPLAQALILTAIVISFAILAYAMILVRRGYDLGEADDPDELSKAIPEEARPE
ncbi:MAG: NADH-quinone oxidoreductase subunit K [Fimbriimonadaceae bacterium]|jgi:multicomponent Na+:H+ antiporter subunit C|nr:NADH-quinone oxidoreductase subunit K [Fimbriimonadaceae bacterium]